MLLRPPDIDVPKEAPFQYDLLGRAEQSLAARELISQADTPLVISLNAPWGQGKTTFLKMWKQDLENSHIPCIYFNAWENDFSSDAFTSLLSEIGVGIQGLFSNKQPAISSGLAKAKQVGVKLIKSAAPGILKAATMGAIDIDKALEETIGKAAEKWAEEQLKCYEESKKSVGAFRERLGDLVKEIEGKEQYKLPLVVIIDELDRCRPTFAIQLLERAKHFFNVKGLVFVVSIDKQQLGHSIQAVYGEKFDVEGYLLRFFDLEWRLPQVGQSKYAKALFSKFGLEDYFSRRQGESSRYDRSNFEKLFEELFQLFQLTLREQEFCFRCLTVVAKSTSEKYKIFPHLTAFMIVLRLKNSDLYSQFSQHDADTEVIFNYLKTLSGGQKFLLEHNGIVLEAQLVTCRHGSKYDVKAKMKSYDEIAKNQILTQEDRERAAFILRMIQGAEWDRETGNLSHIVHKIEVASKLS